MPMPFLTLLLNASLKTISSNAQWPDTTRLDALLMQSSWGNWCAYAVTGGGPRMPDAETEELRRAFDDVIFGVRICPYCQKSSKHEKPTIPALRWHRNCLALAYAKDAERFGSGKQREWARGVLTGVDLHVRIMRDEEDGDAANTGAF